MSADKPSKIKVTISDSDFDADKKPKPAEKPAEKKLPAKIPDKAPVAEGGKDTIYIDVEDQITTIIDKVEDNPKSELSLVLPKRSTTLQSIVNMRLLKRSAEQAGKEITLITNEDSILPLAGAAEVNVAKNLQAKPYIPASPVAAVAGLAAASKLRGGDDIEIDEKDATLDAHREAGELADPQEADEPETIKLSEDDDAKADADKVSARKPDKQTAKKDKKLKVPNFDKFKLFLIMGIIGIVGLIALFIVANKVLPKTTITVKTTGTPISSNFDVTAADNVKTVDTAKKQVPSASKTSDQNSTQTVGATGQQNNGDKAAGSVSMTAQDCSAPFSTPSDVPAGTGLSSGGLTFITQSKTSFSISGASGSCVNYNSTAATGVAAQVGGAKYNVSGASFSVSGRSDVTATGTTSGGTDNNVTIVSKTDIDAAKKKVTTQSSDDFSKNFLKQLSDQGYYVVASTLKIADPAITATPDVGQPASTVSVKIKITYSVLAIKKDDLKKIVSAELTKKINGSTQQILDTDLLKSLTISVSNQSSPSNATLNISASASATPNISVETVKKQAAGKKSGAITDSLNATAGVKDVEVHMSPFWVSTAPKNLSKITVELKQVNDSNASGQ